MDPLPISPLVDLTICIITVVIAAVLARNYFQGNRNDFIRSFAEAYTLFAIGYLIFSMSTLLAPRTVSILHFSFVIGHFCLLSGAAKVSSLIYGIIFPNREEIQHNSFLIFCMINLLIILVPLRYTSYIWLNLDTGIAEWLIHPLVAVVLFTTIYIYLLVIFFFFLFEALKKKNSRLARVRSLFIASSALMIMIGAFFYYAAASPWQALSSSILISFGFLLGFIGVMYKESLNIWNRKKV